MTKFSTTMLLSNFFSGISMFWLSSRSRTWSDLYVSLHFASFVFKNFLASTNNNKENPQL